MDHTALFFIIFSLNHKNIALDQLMIFSAEYLIYITLLMMFLLAFKGSVKEKKSLLLALISFPIVILLIKLIHLFLVIDRPCVEYDISPLILLEPDASFPSRHASIISAIAFSYLALRSKWYPLMLTVVLLIGVSRVYVGVHFPIDILGGMIVGIIAVSISWNIKNLPYRRFFS